MARVPETARGKISLEHGIHCCPKFLISFARPASLYCEEHTHTPDQAEIVYQLPLLPNNTASETFLHKSGAVRSFDWIFLPLGRRSGGDWAYT